MTITHLEITDRASFSPARAPAIDYRLVQAEVPSPELSRYLYTAVGSDWWWYSRLPWTYAQWLAYLDRPAQETWVAYVAGTPAGYFELERQPGANVQRAVPTALQGRVGSVNMVGTFGGLVIGSGIGGLLARAYGVTAPFWFAFVGSAIFLVLIWRELRHIAHADEEGAESASDPMIRA